MAAGAVKPFDRRLLRHARATRRLLVASVGVGLASTTCVVVQATLLATVISRTFLDHAGLTDLRPELGGLIAVAVGRAALVWAGEVVASSAAASATGELRAALLDRASRSTTSRSAEHVGRQVALATTGLDAFETYVARYVPQLVLAGTAPVIVLAWIAANDYTAGIIVACTLPLIPVFMVLVGLATADRANARLRTLSDLGAHFLDVVEGLPTLRAFRRGRAQSESIRRVTERFRHETMGTLRVAFLSALVLELLATLGTALVAVAIGLRLVDGGIDLRTALAVLILVPEAYLPIRSVGAQFHAAADGVAAAHQALDVIEAPTSERNHRDGEGSPLGLGQREPGSWTVRLEGVTVIDEGRARPALEGVDLELRAGERIALAGPSGSGKSTLLSVLLGFTPPSAGRVVIERPGSAPVDLTDVDPDVWLAQLAWVPQQPRLITGTVGDNVRLGRPAAADAEVWNALRGAGLAETVARLPGALDAPVGEAGARLSAGERQRLSLARAFLRDAPLVLLDEPTASLDPASEAAIEDALCALATGRTLVVVAHRLRLARSADRIVMLDGGRIVGQRVPMEVA